MSTKPATAVKTIKLPPDILETDLQRPAWDAKDNQALVEGRYGKEHAEFELWYTEKMGWCIPTLLIGRARSANTTDRTYATTLDGKPVRIGKGPHVLRTVTVYVRVSRLAVLQKYLDTRTAGAATAGQIRDRISSRRAQGQEERAAGHRSWLWDAR